MDIELEDLHSKMKNDINEIKEKYRLLKQEIKNKYKKLNNNNKRRSIPKIIKDNLWNKTFTEKSGLGQCFVCKGKITSRSFDCGHVISVANGGTDQLDNLQPVCSTCNKSMGTQNMIEFKQQYFKEKTPKLMNTQTIDQTGRHTPRRLADFVYPDNTDLFGRSNTQKQNSIFFG